MPQALSPTIGHVNLIDPNQLINAKIGQMYNDKIIAKINSAPLFSQQNQNPASTPVPPPPPPPAWASQVRDQIQPVISGNLPSPTTAAPPQQTAPMPAWASGAMARASAGNQPGGNLPSRSGYAQGGPVTLDQEYQIEAARQKRKFPGSQPQGNEPGRETDADPDVSPSGLLSQAKSMRRGGPVQRTGYAGGGPVKPKPRAPGEDDTVYDSTATAWRGVDPYQASMAGRDDAPTGYAKGGPVRRLRPRKQAPAQFNTEDLYQRDPMLGPYEGLSDEERNFKLDLAMAQAKHPNLRHEPNTSSDMLGPYEGMSDSERRFKLKLAIAKAQYPNAKFGDSSGYDDDLAQRAAIVDSNKQGPAADNQLAPVEPEDNERFNYAEGGEVEDIDTGPDIDTGYAAGGSDPTMSYAMGGSDQDAVDASMSTAMQRESQDPEEEGPQDQQDPTQKPKAKKPFKPKVRRPKLPRMARGRRRRVASQVTGYAAGGPVYNYDDGGDVDTDVAAAAAAEERSREEMAAALAKQQAEEAREAAVKQTDQPTARIRPDEPPPAETTRSDSAPDEGIRSKAGDTGGALTGHDPDSELQIGANEQVRQALEHARAQHGLGSNIAGDEPPASVPTGDEGLPALTEQPYYGSGRQHVPRNQPGSDQPSADQSTFSLAGQAAKKGLESAGRSVADAVTGFIKNPPGAVDVDVAGALGSANDAIKQKLIDYINGTNGHPPEVSQATVEKIKAEHGLDHNDASHKAIVDYVNAGDMDSAHKQIQGYKQLYEPIIRHAQGAANQGDLQRATELATEAHQHVPDNRKVTYEVTPGKNVLATINDGSGTPKYATLTAQQFHDYLVGPGTNFDHQIENGIEKNLDIAARQPEAPEHAGQIRMERPATGYGGDERQAPRQEETPRTTGYGGNGGDDAMVRPTPNAGTDQGIVRSTPNAGTDQGILRPAPNASPANVAQARDTADRVLSNANGAGGTYTGPQGEERTGPNTAVGTPNQSGSAQNDANPNMPAGYNPHWVTPYTSPYPNAQAIANSQGPQAAIDEYRQRTWKGDLADDNRTDEEIYKTLGLKPGKPYIGGANIPGTVYERRGAGGQQQQPTTTGQQQPTYTGPQGEQRTGPNTAVGTPNQPGGQQAAAAAAAPAQQQPAPAGGDWSNKPTGAGAPGSKLGIPRGVDAPLVPKEIEQARNMPEYKVMSDPGLLQHLPEGYFQSDTGKAALNRVIDHYQGYEGGMAGVFPNNERGNRDLANHLLWFTHHDLYTGQSRANVPTGLLRQTDVGGREVSQESHSRSQSVSKGGSSSHATDSASYRDRPASEFETQLGRDQRAGNIRSTPSEYNPAGFGYSSDAARPGGGRRDTAYERAQNRPTDYNPSPETLDQVGRALGVPQQSGASRPEPQPGTPGYIRPDDPKLYRQPPSQPARPEVGTLSTDPRRQGPESRLDDQPPSWPRPGPQGEATYPGGLKMVPTTDPRYRNLVGPNGETIGSSVPANRDLAPHEVNEMYYKHNQQQAENRLRLGDPVAVQALTVDRNKLYQPLPPPQQPTAESRAIARDYLVKNNIIHPDSPILGGGGAGGGAGAPAPRPTGNKALDDFNRQIWQQQQIGQRADAGRAQQASSAAMRDMTAHQQQELINIREAEKAQIPLTPIQKQIKELHQQKTLELMQGGGGGQNSGGGQGGGSIRVNSVQEAMQLPHGTHIILPDGSPGVVP